MNFLDVSSVSDLALYLGASDNALNKVINNINRGYFCFEINKKSGGVRDICAPNRELKNIQRKLQNELVLLYSPRIHVHGYIGGRDILSNAAYHKGQRWLGKVDVESFFPSIHYGRVFGVFCKHPFNFPRAVSHALASLCTHNGTLPQGAPTSPIISNLILRRFDLRMSDLAKENRCYYTRYADDLFFSTNKSKFPRDILYFDRAEMVCAGRELREIFDAEDFSINEDKLKLINKSQRQLVTGIVVNEKLNVPREYIRELRAMLYSWRRYGLKAAESLWREKYANSNRWGCELSDFKWAVRGKLEHIGHVKGKGDPVYLKYAKQVMLLDPSFVFLDENVEKFCIKVFTEGKTDRQHLAAALRYFNAQRLYTGIRLEFCENKVGNGEAGLEKLCRSLCLSAQKEVTVAIFDRDTPGVYKKMEEKGVGYKYHDNNVYSLVIPTPEFRKENDKVCIEMCYRDEDLRKKDSHGRRLYLRSEFVERSGQHKDEKYVYCSQIKASNLVVEEVYSNKKIEIKKMSMSKADFADYIFDEIKPFDDFDFSGFKGVFDILMEICARPKI